MKVFAHRGFSGKYPENTMLAFKKAEEVGCYGIELDVQLTKDDEIVIMHDETIDRTTSGTGNIRDYTYQELCLVDCYGKFEGKYDFQRIPTLREYLTWVKDTGLVTNIELKNSVYYYEHLEEKVIDMVRDCHAHGIGVNVWTVNKKELMEQLNNWNVDGIFTNFPDRAKELGLEK